MHRISISWKVFAFFVRKIELNNNLFVGRDTINSARFDTEAPLVVHDFMLYLIYFMAFFIACILILILVKYIYTNRAKLKEYLLFTNNHLWLFVIATLITVVISISTLAYMLSANLSSLDIPHCGVVVSALGVWLLAYGFTYSLYALLLNIKGAFKLEKPNISFTKRLTNVMWSTWDSKYIILACIILVGFAKLMLIFIFGYIIHYFYFKLLFNLFIAFSFLGFASWVYNALKIANGTCLSRDFSLLSENVIKGVSLERVAIMLLCIITMYMFIIPGLYVYASPVIYTWYISNFGIEHLHGPKGWEDHFKQREISVRDRSRSPVSERSGIRRAENSVSSRRAGEVTRGIAGERLRSSYRIRSPISALDPITRSILQVTGVNTAQYLPYDRKYPDIISLYGRNSHRSGSGSIFFYTDRQIKILDYYIRNKVIWNKHLYLDKQTTELYKLKKAKIYIDVKLQESPSPLVITLNDEIFNHPDFLYNRQQFARQLKDSVVDLRNKKYLDTLNNDNAVLSLSSVATGYYLQADRIEKGSDTFLSWYSGALDQDIKYKMHIIDLESAELTKFIKAQNELVIKKLQRGEHSWY